MTVTEVATLPLIPGSTVEDASTAAGKVWRDMYDTLLQQDGIQTVRYGRVVESPDSVILFVDWESHQHHLNFMASAPYAGFLKTLSGLLSGAPSITHFTFKPSTSLALVLGAPVTELATFTLPSSESSKFDASLGPFGQTVEKTAEGCAGTAWGWSVEDVEHEKLDDGKGKACLLAVGWQSVEAHMAYRETEGFKEAIGPLRDGPVAVEMRHVEAKGF